MSPNQERIEQAIRLLTQAQAGLATIDFTPTRSAADTFLPTLAANVDNEKLSDANFGCLCGIRFEAWSSRPTGKSS